MISYSMIYSLTCRHGYGGAVDRRGRGRTRGSQCDRMPAQVPLIARQGPQGDTLPAKVFLRQGWRRRGIFSLIGEGGWGGVFNFVVVQVEGGGGVRPKLGFEGGPAARAGW